MSKSEAACQKCATDLIKTENLFQKIGVYQLRDAIAEPIINKFYEDPTLVTYGEDVRDWGGHLLSIGE